MAASLGWEKVSQPKAKSKAKPKDEAAQPPLPLAWQPHTTQHNINHMFAGKVRRVEEEGERSVGVMPGLGFRV